MKKKPCIKDGGATGCKEPALLNQQLEDSSWLPGSTFYFVTEILGLFVSSASNSLTNEILYESHYKVILNPGCMLQTPWKLSKKAEPGPGQLNLNHWEEFGAFKQGI